MHVSRPTSWDAAIADAVARPATNHRDRVLSGVRKAAAAGVINPPLVSRQRPVDDGIHQKVADALTDSVGSNWGYVTAPAIGALLGGSLGTVASGVSNMKQRSKDPAQKRRELLRAAVLGATLGGLGGMGTKLITSGAARTALGAVGPITEDSDKSKALWTAGGAAVGGSAGGLSTRIGAHGRVTAALSGQKGEFADRILPNQGEKIKLTLSDGTKLDGKSRTVINQLASKVRGNQGWYSDLLGRKSQGNLEKLLGTEWDRMKPEQRVAALTKELSANKAKWQGEAKTFGTTRTNSYDVFTHAKGLEGDKLLERVKKMDSNLHKMIEDTVRKNRSGSIFHTFSPDHQRILSRELAGTRANAFRPGKTGWCRLPYGTGRGLAGSAAGGLLGYFLEDAQRAGARAFGDALSDTTGLKQ